MGEEVSSWLKIIIFVRRSNNKSKYAKKKSICNQAGNCPAREEQLALEVENLRKALAYSELRNEALHEVLKIGKEQYGIDLLKKAGAKQ